MQNRLNTDQKKREKPWHLIISSSKRPAACYKDITKEEFWKKFGTSFGGIADEAVWESLIRRYKDMECGGKYDKDTKQLTTPSSNTYLPNDLLLENPLAPLLPLRLPGGDDLRGKEFNPLRHRKLHGEVIGEIRLQDDKKYEATLPGRAGQLIRRQAMNESRSNCKDDGVVSTPYGVVLSNGRHGSVNWQSNWTDPKPAGGVD